MLYCINIGSTCQTRFLYLSSLRSVEQDHPDNFSTHTLSHAPASRSDSFQWCLSGQSCEIADHVGFHILLVWSTSFTLHESRKLRIQTVEMYEPHSQALPTPVYNDGCRNAGKRSGLIELYIILLPLQTQYPSHVEMERVASTSSRSCGEG